MPGTLATVIGAYFTYLAWKGVKRRKESQRYVVHLTHLVITCPLSETDDELVVGR